MLSRKNEFVTRFSLGCKDIVKKCFTHRIESSGDFEGLDAALPKVDGNEIEADLSGADPEWLQKEYMPGVPGCHAVIERILAPNAFQLFGKNIKIESRYNFLGNWVAVSLRDPISGKEAAWWIGQDLKGAAITFEMTAEGWGTPTVYNFGQLYAATYAYFNDKKR